MRRLVCMILIFSCVTLKAQFNVDVEDIFKLQLFLDKKSSTHSSTKNIVKNDSLYQIFSNSIELNIDTLRVESKLYEFIDPFQYYKIDLRNTTQKLSRENSEIQSLSLFHGLNTICIIAINPKTGLVYRLKGFNDNNFLTFLRDFKEIYKRKTDKAISSNKLIKKYKLPDVNFKCLYKGLRAKNIDIQKYPCLIRYSEPVQIE